MASRIFEVRVETPLFRDAHYQEDLEAYAACAVLSPQHGAISKANDPYKHLAALASVRDVPFNPQTDYTLPTNPNSNIEARSQDQDQE